MSLTHWPFKKALRGSQHPVSVVSQKISRLKIIRKYADLNSIRDNLVVNCKNLFQRIKQGNQSLTNNNEIGSNADASGVFERNAKYSLRSILDRYDWVTA
jgi:hypothetical protein